MLRGLGPENVKTGVRANELASDVQHADDDRCQRQCVQRVADGDQRRVLVGHGGCAVGTLDTGTSGAHPYRDRKQRGQPATEEQAEDQNLQRSLVIEPVAHSVPAFFASGVWGAAAETSPLLKGEPARPGLPSSSSPAVRSPFHSALTLLWSTLVLRDRRWMATPAATSRARPTIEPK